MPDLKSLGWLADWVIRGWQRVPAPVVHNLGKARALKMAFWHANLEGTPGCYVEFGVATGNSLRAAEVAERTAFSPSLGVPHIRRRLHGFDTFKSFASASPDDAHPVWSGERFNIPMERVEKRFRSDLGDRVQLHQVNASELPAAVAPPDLGIEECAIVLLDMDLSQPTLAALDWLEPTFTEGTLVLLDEYCGFGGSPTAGEAGAFNAFLSAHRQWGATLFTTYGDGGRAYVLYRQTP